MSIVTTYLTELKQRLTLTQKHDLSLACGATQQQLASLLRHYPETSPALLELVGQINGTWWQRYGETTIGVLMLGSDVFEYPYYLMSVEQMLQEATRSGERSIAKTYQDFPEACEIDVRIDPTVPDARRLCFSQCMNNGGTSILYLDFTPAPTGVVGQVIRFLHDPDSFQVIADSFEAYLQTLIDANFAFLTEDCE